MSENLNIYKTLRPKTETSVYISSFLPSLIPQKILTGVRDLNITFIPDQRGGGTRRQGDKGTRGKI